MNWAQIPYMVPLILLAIATIVGAGFAIQRRSSPGSLPLAFLLAGIAIWSLGYWMELAAVTPELKLAWARFEYIGIVTVPVAWLCLAIQYTGRGEWLTPGRLALLVALPAATLFAVWWDGSVGWMFTNVQIIEHGAITGIKIHYGWLFWVFMLYVSVVMLWGMALIVRSMRATHSSTYRRQQAALLAGALAPMLANLLHVTGNNPFAPLDLAPLAASLTALTAFGAIFQLQGLEKSPAARSAVVEYINDAVLIIAPSGKIVDLNPAARRFVVAGVNPFGEPLQTALTPEFPAAAFLAQTHPGTLEVDRGEGYSPRYLEAGITLLPGAPAGGAMRIIVLHDITRRREQWEKLRENEKKLIESQALYHSLVETLPQYILRKDAQARITFANQNHLRMSGLTLDQMVGKTDHELYPAEAADKYLQDDLYVMTTGETIEVVEEHYIDDFEKILVRVVKTPLYDPDGRINGTQCIFWDVTEKEKSEQALIESEQRFRTSVESMLDGFAVFSSIRDEQGKIVDFRYEYINDAGCRLNMRPREEHIGRRLLEVLPGHKESGMLAEKIRVVETGRPITRESLTYEDVYGKDRQHIARAYDYQTVKLGDGLAVTWRDVTERKRREIEIEQKNETIERMYQELHENERRFHASVEAMLDGFAIVTPFIEDEGRVVDFYVEYINEAGCKMIGKTFDELVGASISGMLPHEPRAQAIDDYLGVVRTGDPLIEEIVTYRSLADGGRELERCLEVRAVRLGNGLALSWRDITERKLDEEKRTHWVRELEQHNRDMMLLNDLGELLQACRTDEEAYQIIASDMPLFFPGCSGAMYILNNSRSSLECRSGWGDTALFAASLDPSDCWGMRLGKLHISTGKHPRTACKHFGASTRTGAVCIPMIAQNNAFGVLSLMVAGENESTARILSDDRLQLFQTVAEQISLALANLQLRETLRRQAIRDPLTNLFNRRYMEETLEREISRAQRRSAGLGLLMIDIDHFKIFNDEYGHDAGDVVLREMGSLLLNRTRKEDVVCRYGGEEFLVIIPEAGEADILARAEELRSAVNQMHIVHHERLLRQVTISTGVAVFPFHGTRADALFKAADTALYASKRAGRNRVCMAEGKTDG